MAAIPASWSVEEHTAPENANYTAGRTPELAVTVPGVPDRTVVVGHEARSDFTGMGLEPANLATLSYDVYIPEDMDWGASGGKLPGLAGSLQGAASLPTGGDPLDGPYWSGRGMFNESGQVFGYLYVHEVNGFPKGTYGIGLHPTGTGMYLLPGRWNRIQMTYRMNTPGVADGWFKMSLNGDESIRYGTVKYRLAEHPKLLTNYLLHQFRYGGSGLDDGPPAPTTLVFRNHRITTAWRA